MDPKIIDRLFSGMVRGFGYGLGRRAAYRVPLFPAVLLIAALYYMKSHGALG